LHRLQNLPGKGKTHAVSGKKGVGISTANDSRNGPAIVIHRKVDPYFPLAVCFCGCGGALGFGIFSTLRPYFPLGLASGSIGRRVLFAGQAERRQERHLRVRTGVAGDAWVQFRSAYYLYAIIFLIFDVEAIFLLPFAVAFTGLGVGACLAMLVFVLLLAEGWPGPGPRAS
jgi:hypothetical protein